MKRIILFVLLFTALESFFMAKQSEKQHLGFPPSPPAKPFELVFAETPKRKGFIVRVDHNPNYHGRFPEDQYLLLIYSPTTNPRPIHRYRFTSSYMEFDLKAEDLTGDGVEELILIHGIGRGTNVRSETLTVFQWDESKLNPILSVPFSGFCGVDPWTYLLTFPKGKKSGNVHLSLELKDIPSVGGLCSPNLLPKYAYKEYCWSEKEKLMTRYRFIQREKESPNK